MSSVRTRYIKSDTEQNFRIKTKSVSVYSSKSISSDEVGPPGVALSLLFVNMMRTYAYAYFEVKYFIFILSVSHLELERAQNIVNDVISNFAVRKGIFLLI